MLTASVKNMLVTSIDTTLETGIVPTQYIVIISTVRRQSQIGIQRWIDVSPIVNFCLGFGDFQIIINNNTILLKKFLVIRNSYTEVIVSMPDIYGARSRRSSRGCWIYPAHVTKGLKSCRFL